MADTQCYTYRYTHCLSIQNVDDGQVQQQITTVECPEQPRGQLQINIDMQIGTLTSIAGELRPAVQPQQLQQRRMDYVHADMHSNQMLQNSTASSTKGRQTTPQRLPSCYKVNLSHLLQISPNLV
jgi:hypothetical protein